MRDIVSTTNAPAAIGPYSQAVGIGGLLFTSGQIPLLPDGSLVEGDVEAQTRQVLANLAPCSRPGAARSTRWSSAPCSSPT
jgi:2-iminobutanoate/2-iminopropanoate deaminase